MYTSTLRLLARVSETRPVTVLKGPMLFAIVMLAPTMSAAQSAGIQFVTPADEDIVRPGTTIPVVIDVDPALGASQVFLQTSFISDGQLASELQPSYETTVTIPTNARENLSLTAIAEDGDPNTDFLAVEKISLIVIPEDPPVEIGIAEDSELFWLAPEPSDPKQILVFGRYADGVSRPIHNARMGTTYTSSDPAVASVDANGVLSPIAPGRALVTVRNGSLVDWVGVTVLEEYGAALPAIDQTSKVSVTTSGFRKDPSSGHLVQQVLVTNVSALPIPKALILVIEDLPSSVRLVNAVDTTQSISPSGTPFVFLGDFRGSLLRPGQAVETELRFFSAQNAPVTYRAGVYTAAPGEE